MDWTGLGGVDGYPSVQNHVTPLSLARKTRIILILRLVTPLGAKTATHLLPEFGVMQATKRANQLQKASSGAIHYLGLQN